MWIVGAVAAVCLLGSSSAGAATGGIGGRPADPDPDNPRSQSIFINTVDRGKSAEDKVLVSNGSDETKTIEIYVVDGVVTNTGAYTCRQRAEPLSGSGRWIQLSQNEVTLGPDSKLEIPFIVSVPDNADVGEHNACLVFEEKDDAGQASGNIRLHTRQAVRAVTTVPGDLHREIKLDSFSVKSSEGNTTFSLTTSNKGNVSADVSIKVYLVSMFNKTKYDNGGVYPVLPNEKLDLTYEQTDGPFWGGWYDARVAIEYNTNAGMLGFDKSADRAEVFSENQMIFIAPSAGAIGVMSVVALAILTGLLAWVLGVREKSKRENSWVKYSIVKGDTLEDIATKRGVSWKVIAKYNQIRAPFTLQEGQSIKVPAITAGKPKS